MAFALSPPSAANMRPLLICIEILQEEEGVDGGSNFVPHCSRARALLEQQIDNVFPKEKHLLPR